MLKVEGDRCARCNKRALVSHQCKCGLRFCIPHRHTDHGCTYNYREDDRKKLEKNLIKVEAERIVKI